MLQRPDVNCDAISRLADHLADNVADDEFNMNSCCRCIAGHSLRLFRQDATGIGSMSKSASDLGLNCAQASLLFGYPWDATRSQAVSVLRNLAVTGTVDWAA